EMLGQVGLEMLRIDREKLRDEVVRLLTMVPPTADAPSILAIRQILNKPATKKEGEAALTSQVANAQAHAFKGDKDAALSALRATKPEDRIRGLAAAAQILIDSKPSDAAALLEVAKKEA